MNGIYQPNQNRPVFDDTAYALLILFGLLLIAMNRCG